MAGYVPYPNPDFIGVTDSPEDLQKLTGRLGLLYERVDSENSKMGYLMDYSASIIPLNPRGSFPGPVRSPHRVGAMEKDLQTLIQKPR